MATRRGLNLSGAGNTAGSGMSTGNASTSGTKWWYIHTQNFYGIYERLNTYDRTLSSVSLPAPSITYNYLSIDMKETNIDELVYMDFSGGSFNQFQQVMITGDGTSGGFGTQGNIGTSAVGIMRRPATLGANGYPVESSGTCVKNFKITSDSSPGTYNTTGSFDTSSNTQTVLYQILAACKINCKSFETFLVDI